MLIFSVLSALIALVSALRSYDLENEWKQFQLAYNRNYTNRAELHYRKEIFNKNLESIEKHNEAYEAGQQSYMQGVNQFTDLTFEEVQKRLLGYKGDMASADSSVDLDILKVNDEDVPDSLDLKEKGYVTRVKYEGRCSSCWAFSAVGSIEGQLYKATKKLVSLSEQELVDCSKSNSGCHRGGSRRRAFEDLKEIGGIALEESYPYEGVDGECKFEKEMAVAEVTGFKTLLKDESELKKAVATIGPISVSVQATDNFIKYKNGVFYDSSCYGERTNHAVLVVGYEKDNWSGQDYWIVKNSWNDRWGENGYIRMSRNRDNNCNISSVARYPFVTPIENNSSFTNE